MLALDLQQVWTARDARLQQAKTETNNLARSLAQHAEDVFETTDAVIKVLRDNVVYGGTNPTAIQRLEHWMRIRVSGTSFIQRIFVYDEQGNSLASSLDASAVASVRSLNHADRDFFRYHRDHTDDDTALIGHPIQAKSDGDRVITISRRLNHPDGSFAGVVGASISLGLFQHFFETFDIGRQGAITLASGDGTLFVRRPFDEQNVGRDISQSEPFEKTQDHADAGNFAFISFLDGTPRLGSFRRVPGFNLIVIVALDKNEVLASWRHETQTHLAWLTVTILFVATLGYRLTQQIRGRSLAEAQLAVSKQTLEDRVVARTDDLQKMVVQRDLLLREVYHRVKNNLQFVDSLIEMEIRRSADKAMKDRLAALRNRVFSLGLVHQQLMSSDNLDTFSIRPVLNELAANVVESVGMAERGLQLAIEADPVIVNLDFAIPVGLIATELLTNAIKHASAKVIKMEFHTCANGDAVLIVEDDGEDGELGISRMTSHQGIGSKLIEGFTKQLGGRMDIFHHAGTRIEIHMPLPETV
jgi:two-component sensor histidine kinase